MKTYLNTFIFTSITLLTIGSSTAFTGYRQESAVLTSKQLQADKIALGLYQNKAIQQAEKDLINRLLSDSLTVSENDKKAAIQAAKELVYSAVELAVNYTPDKPSFMWLWHLPRKEGEVAIPGSRVALDNPDNVYRIAIIDSSSTYEIRLTRSKTPPVQESLELLNAESPFSGKQEDFIEGKNIVWNADNTALITINGDKTGTNSLHSKSPFGLIIYRNTHSDWHLQSPEHVSIRRINGKSTYQQSEAKYIRHTQHYIRYFADFLVDFNKNNAYKTKQDNVIEKPFGRGGNWGFAAIGHFSIKNNEALVVTLNPHKAKYLGFELADKWQVSIPYISSSTSLNNTQAIPNKDGNYTYVIAAHDPGVHNWLDTRGISEGTLFIRWQYLDTSVKSIDDAVVSQQLVNISDLKKTLPEKTIFITPSDRKTILEARAISYQNRLK